MSTMRIISLLLFSLLLAACGTSTEPEPEAPPEQVKSKLPTAAPSRTIEDYNPDNDQRALDDLIVVDNLPAEATVSSPFTVSGKARGTWFSEGSFPVFLTDENGKLLAESFGHSEESWMTSEFIPFTVTLNYDAPAGIKASLELMLDNPAGPKEGFDRSLIIPVVLE